MTPEGLTRGKELFREIERAKKEIAWLEDCILNPSDITAGMTIWTNKTRDGYFFSRQVHDMPNIYSDIANALLHKEREKLNQLETEFASLN